MDSELAFSLVSSNDYNLRVICIRFMALLISAFSKFPFFFN